jgi:hypothetical protein
MHNDASRSRDRMKSYHDCVEELRILVESAEDDCGDLGHAQLFVWEMEGALVFTVVPHDPKAGRDAETRLEEILGGEHA